MVLNAGIITHRFRESKDFYTTVLDFGITFENDWFVLLHTPDHRSEIGFLQPDHPTQASIFRKAFAGKGVYITLEVENVDAAYEKIQAKGIPIEVPLQEEPWGDRHFAIVDPNGIGVDIVTYRATHS